jgi:hypothetical protein
METPDLLPPRMSDFAQRVGLGPYKIEAQSGKGCLAP